MGQAGEVTICSTTNQIPDEKQKHLTPCKCLIVLLPAIGDREAKS